MIISKLGNCEKTIAKHECFFEACLGAIDKVEELRKALIPFFYITLHYKFAYIDMFVWHNDQPYMVEIKSTRYHNNNSFKISSSEVNEALANENYMLVRVTPESINFL